jgi:dihydroxyacid dehydratase/phosphogluconate dehydratase
MKARIDDPAEGITADDVLVLRNAGPLGAPGMPEWGMLPIPKRLLEQGVRDMVRLSDARMSGTSYGTCVLHIAPESAEGGPLGLVRTGDLIELDVPGRTLNLLVGEEELAERRAAGDTWRGECVPTRASAPGPESSALAMPPAVTASVMPTPSATAKPPVRPINTAAFTPSPLRPELP